MLSLTAIGLGLAAWWLSVRSRLLALAPVLLISCQTAKKIGGEIGGNVAEVIACPIGLFECGHVWLCAAPADNALGHIEICVDDDSPIADVEAVYGHCEPTPRHQGLCKVCCSGDCGRGGNAYSGTWCP